MNKNMNGRIVWALAGLLLGGCASQVVSQPKAFTDWPASAAPEVIGKKVAMGANFPARPGAHYAADSVWMSALKFAALTKDEALQMKLVKGLDPVMTPDWKTAYASVQRHVDHNIFGIVPLEIYMRTKDKKYLDFGKWMADRQWEQPNAEGLSDQTRFWIDDMYMITILQVQAYRATGDKVYLDRAAREMVAYLDKLQQPNGLFYHGEKFPFFWGRGDGWIAAGMPELLSELPADHPKRARIMEGYKKMMAALLKYQDTDGMWHQLIDHPESYKETSCTGMFTYAFITGVKKGWLTDPAYADAARKGWLGLQTYIDTNGKIDSVCVGTGQTNSLQFYLTRPTRKGDDHGQAPLLWCAVALLK